MIMAANLVLPMLAPHPSTYLGIPMYTTRETSSGSVLEYMGMYSCKSRDKPKLSDERSDQLFSKLNLTSIESWSEADQQKAIDLLKEYHHLFALDDLELGCTSQVKHTIKVTDPVPFKQRYQ